MDLHVRTRIPTGELAMVKAYARDRLLEKVLTTCPQENFRNARLSAVPLKERATPHFLFRFEMSMLCNWTPPRSRDWHVACKRVERSSLR